MDSLVLGGGFNPIHNGHLGCASAVAHTMGFTRVLLIPCGDPPLPKSTPLVPAADRLEMCRLAAHASPLFEVDALEINRPGPSFTIDTARQLRQRGWKTIHWLIGADTLPQLPSWHQADILLQEVHFVIVQRPGCKLEWGKLPEPFRKLQANAVTGPLIPISSSDIRRRVAVGESIHDLVPAEVERYILERKLYRPGAK
jgi:nicotinate-nucleotide adenylyltransferase